MTTTVLHDRVIAKCYIWSCRYRSQQKDSKVFPSSIKRWKFGKGSRRQWFLYTQRVIPLRKKVKKFSDSFIYWLNVVKLRNLPIGIISNMYVNFCLILTISFWVMSVTESPTSKNKSDLSNNQSIQIGDTSGQVLKKCCFYPFLVKYSWF